MAPAHTARASAGADSIKGLAQSVAKPAYRRLLTAEPALRRAVPVLIIAFLFTMAVGALVQINDQRRQAVAGIVRQLALFADLTGERLDRDHRLSQAELARRIGISPSALSQAERGRAGLSVETLARALDALGSPFGPGQGDGSPSYRVTRRGARRISSLAPGLEAEELAGAPAGTEFFLLTFAPGASARRPPFATKRSEVLVVISGVLELRIGEGRESLQAGDAMVLSSEPVGSWRCPGPDQARVLWTILP